VDAPHALHVGVALRRGREALVRVVLRRGEDAPPQAGGAGQDADRHHLEHEQERADRVEAERKGGEQLVGHADSAAREARGAL
jgi:hypothetical protein